MFDGIGGLAITALAGLFYHLFWKPKKDKPVGAAVVIGDGATIQHGTKGTGHTIIVNAPVAGGLTVGDAVAGQPAVKNEMQSPPPAVIAKLSTVTAKEIRDALQSVPPFQQGEIKEFYIGQPIDWNCSLSSANKLKGGRVDVSLNCEDGSSMTCHGEVLLREYPQLRVLPTRKPVRITGTVKKFSGLYHIWVKDAKLYY